MTDTDLNEIMPCGHLARYTFPLTGDEGTTRFCLVCELNAITKGLHLGEEWEPVTEMIDDGFGTSCPRYCPKCGGEMQFIRPGDCRCSKCEG